MRTASDASKPVEMMQDDDAGTFIMRHVASPIDMYICVYMYVSVSVYVCLHVYICMCGCIHACI